MRRHLVWLRADLRSLDNTALLAACADASTAVACVYAVTPRQWQRHDVAGVRVDFELRTLHALQERLAALNIPLLMLHTPDFATLPADLAGLCQRLGIDEVHANRQYEVNEIARDEAAGLALGELGIALQLHHDQCAVTPGTLCKGDGTYYSVFTPFKRVWLQRLASAGCAPASSPRRRREAFVASDEIPATVPGFASHVSPATALHWWPAGEDAALERLAAFCSEGLAHYDSARNFPDRDGTSRLSPHLAVGSISPRQCLNAAFGHVARHGESADSAQWIAELGWRDFYKHVLTGWPRVCRHQPFRLETAPLRWRHDDADFQRWCEGRTGFPIVDAAMRQLQATGWMHNRLRMIVAMFLTKDLLIDWRWGERFFMQHLIDGDLAANNGGWQWSASTGNDAAPYFRIFNPVTQGRKFDPDGRFIREHIKELGDFSGDVHEPHGPGGSRPSLLTDYPLPMVDHSAARERTLAAFKDMKAAAEFSGS
ncbi:MAG: deoxyribodipyrimidine photo-lyase type [Moraxellaceae bacterium]|nr:deoxyribodipyrimidine photo-lyase type [Moraxellaceae bacterium]